ncbi:MAG: hypothetical protein WC635_11625 [Bacteriovorax sp.]|jgi:hypothetical protein
MKILMFGISALLSVNAMAADICAVYSPEYNRLKVSDKKEREKAGIIAEGFKNKQYHFVLEKSEASYIVTTMFLTDDKTFIVGPKGDYPFFVNSISEAFVDMKKISDDSTYRGQGTDKGHLFHSSNEDAFASAINKIPACDKTVVPNVANDSNRGAKEIKADARTPGPASDNHSK